MNVVGGQGKHRVEVHQNREVAQKILKDLFDDLKCPVCLELFDKPLILGCLHTFCSQCLKDIVQHNTIPCPLCRTSHELDKKGVEGLRINHQLFNIIDKMRQASAKLCDECQQTDAVEHCVTCNADLCLSCTTKIHAPRLLQKHNRSPMSPEDCIGNERAVDAPLENHIEDDDIVVEFSILRVTCLEKLQAWEKSLWFTPTGFKPSSSLRQTKALLLPYWLFEVETSSQFCASGAMSSNVAENAWTTFSDVIATRHRLVVCATDAFDAELLQKIEPWAVDDIKARPLYESNSPFPPPLPSRIQTIPFIIDADQAWATGSAVKQEADKPSSGSVVERKIHSMARESCAKAMKEKVTVFGYYRDLKVKTVITRIAAQRVFLPVYNLKYVYNGKSYSVLVNGQTGQLNGERPYSMGLMATMSITGIAGILGFSMSK